MQKLGIPCACLPKYADGFTPAMQEQLLTDIVSEKKEVRAIFLTPEKLEADAKSSSRTICNALKKLSQSKRIGMIVLDEAHELVLGEDHRDSFSRIKPILNNETAHSQRLCLSGTCDGKTSLAMAHRIDLDIRFSKFFVVPLALLPRHEFECYKLKGSTDLDRCRKVVKKKVEAFTRKHDNILPTGIVFVRQQEDAVKMCRYLQQHFSFIVFGSIILYTCTGIAFLEFPLREN